MMLEIDGKCVGPGQRTLVIAEIGVNHDGSAERALELVKLAADSWADAVKLQIFSAATLMNASARLAKYQEKAAADPTVMLRKYELSARENRQIVSAIRAAGMLPLATPFSLGDVEAIADLDLPAIKIASPDVVNRPLLEKAAKLGRPLIVSTGAATMEEIATTCRWLRRWKSPFALLHCVSSYPTPADAANLCWIDELSERFKAPIGFSDHTIETICGAAAVAAGACIVEKHLTYDRNAAGPDHAASADPSEFAEYIRQIRTAERLRGMPGKRVLEIERDVRSVSRQSLVVAENLEAGRRLRKADLIVQRPGTGIPAAEMATVVGRNLVRPVQSGTLLQWDMLADAA